VIFRLAISTNLTKFVYTNVRAHMKKTQIILTLILTFVIVSCGRNYRIDKDDLKYIPYEKNETLVFKSDLNRYDTIFLKDLQRFNGCYDPLSISPDDCEGYYMACKRSDPNYDRYLEGRELVSIGASSNGYTYISFDIKLKDSWFYNLESFSLEQFDSIPTREMKVENKTYNDVKVFEADGSYSKRDNYVERFYWSVSEGFLGLDRRDEEWRLIKKYVP